MKALDYFRRLAGPMIYEVRLEIDGAIADDLDNWLLDHAREMLAFPGFQSATVYRESMETRRAVRLVVYEVRSKRELNSYLHTHAGYMRKHGVDRFGKQFSASRRILPASEYSLPEGFTPLFDDTRISGGLPVCSNCHLPVSGRFCMHCGQEDRTFMLSLGELFYDLAGSMFNFDSRFLRTMRPLLFRPGWATVEYLRGHRQQHLPPVRLYIFASLIFFFVAALLAEQQFGDEVKAGLRGDRGPVTVETTGDMTPEQRADVERQLERAEKLAGLPSGTLKMPETASSGEENDEETTKPADDAGNSDEDEGNINFSLGGLGSAELEERLERGAKALTDDPQRFAQAFMRQIPTVMLFFLPVMALVLKLLYILSGRYYVEHLIFTLHFHSAVFVLLLLWMLFGVLETAWAFLQTVSGWVTAALWIYLMYYLYKSMRRVYGQGRLLTILKYLALLFAYFVAMVMTLTLTVLYTLYSEA